jgi:hypothetical protein
MVIQLTQSELIDIIQSVVLWNIQALAAIQLPSNNVVQDEVGIIGLSLNARIEIPDVLTVTRLESKMKPEPDTEREYAFQVHQGVTDHNATDVPCPSTFPLPWLRSPAYGIFK